MKGRARAREATSVPGDSATVSEPFRRQGHRETSAESILGNLGGKRACRCRSPLRPSPNQGRNGWKLDSNPGRPNRKLSSLVGKRLSPEAWFVR